MRNLKLIIALLLLTQLNFGQETYKVIEGELQFISPNKGIVIKKDNQFFEMKFNVTFKSKKQNIKTNLVLLTYKELKTIFQKNNSISYNEIDENYDFNKLNNISLNYIEKFRTEEKNYEEYKLCKVNNNFFAIFRDKHEDKNVYTSIEDYMPYIFIKFNNKKVIYTFDNEELFIIPTKKNIKIFSQHDYFSLVLKSEKLKISNSGIFNFSQHAFYDLKDDFFSIDTLENKKVQLKNIYDEVLIKDIYDSINVNRIIYCYKKNNIDLYNLTLNKLNKKIINAAHTYMGNIQILQNNKLKWIDWNGEELKKPSFFQGYGLPESIIEVKPRELEINKSDFIHYLIDKNFYNYHTQIVQKDSISLINANDIENFYFIKNNSFDRIISRNLKNDEINLVSPNGLMYSRYDVVYYKKSNGLFGINFIEKFVNPNFKNEAFDLFQELQSIEFKESFYKLEKNNLFMLYPLVKNFKYKSLGEFQYNFARFELPNGQKGWLSLDGKEYLDE